jgi:hypothetical protein
MSKIEVANLRLSILVDLDRLEALVDPIYRSQVQEVIKLLESKSFGL